MTKTVFERTIPTNPLTAEQSLNFKRATHCHVCEKPFRDGDERVRDDCHLTGTYRDPAHVKCNLTYQTLFTLPVVFHNLYGYDAQFILKEHATAFDGKVDLLPLTKEKYILFTKHVAETGTNNADSHAKKEKCIKIRFIDSFKVLSSGLAKLASYLDESKLRIVRNEFINLSDDDFKLLTRKGVFPYDYLTVYDKWHEKCLPAREAFHNRLCDNHVSHVDYIHEVNV
ncbi:hypothetical protein WN55_05659 [Dufourea novaeangliae]|uniref:DNA-directed DNA polymerase n=1 Tax=Dufourea novaeangliae TaxID=178035 RepID=A0A154PMV6_DUFNO|nr:hypothetical protein WN55_05659 [Dufourea novaeangliae]